MCRELLNTLTSEQLKAAAANGDTALHLAVRRKDIDMVSNKRSRMTLYNKASYM